MDKPLTTTLIRTIYSEQLSYIVVKFCNTSISFQFVPFVRKDEQGKNVYDAQRAQTTTLNWDSAYALMKFGQDIINNTVTEGSIQINGNNSLITLEHKTDPMSNQPQTTISLTKNNSTIPFKFVNHQISVKNTITGQFQTSYIPAGLGAFTKMIEGYLTGINAERHLNKLTDDYVKSLEQEQPKQQQFQPQQQKFQPKKWTPNSNNNQWKQQKFNYQSAAPTSWETNNQQQFQNQSLSSYKINK